MSDIVKPGGPVIPELPEKVQLILDIAVKIKTSKHVTGPTRDFCMERLLRLAALEGFDFTFVERIQA